MNISTWRLQIVNFRRPDTAQWSNTNQNNNGYLTWDSSYHWGVLNKGNFLKIVQRTLKGDSDNDGDNQWSARVVFSISRREWEFLRFNLVHRDETENSWHLLSGFETRPRKNLLQSRASRRDRDLLSSFSGFETRTRILKVAIFPWIQAWTASLFCRQFLGGCYINCRALHFAWCSLILKWPSHILLASMLWFFNYCHRCLKIECF